MSGIIVAIDGYSACGKSTLARQIAQHFGYLFIDSGAMYRAVTYFAIAQQFIPNGNLDKLSLIEKLDSVHIEFRMINGQSRVYLCGKDIEDEIRKDLVPMYVSQVSTIKEVREKLVNEQRNMAKLGGVVMDGRDIGTVVFPNAELKIFVTASQEVRVERRYNELKEKGIQMTKDEILQNLLQRDHLDTTRIESPLKKADDAILLDNTYLSREEQLSWAINQVELKLNRNLF